MGVRESGAAERRGTRLGRGYAFRVEVKEELKGEKGRLRSLL